jgi:hypothetical protein
MERLPAERALIETISDFKRLSVSR